MASSFVHYSLFILALVYIARHPQDVAVLAGTLIVAAILVGVLWAMVKDMLGAGR